MPPSKSRRGLIECDACEATFASEHFHPFAVALDAQDAGWCGLFPEQNERHLSGLVTQRTTVLCPVHFRFALVYLVAGHGTTIAAGSDDGFTIDASIVLPREPVLDERGLPWGRVVLPLDIARNWNIDAVDYDKTNRTLRVRARFTLGEARVTKQPSRFGSAATASYIECDFCDEAGWLATKNPDVAGQRLRALGWRVLVQAPLERVASTGLLRTNSHVLCPSCRAEQE